MDCSVVRNGPPQRATGPPQPYVRPACGIRGLPGNFIGGGIPMALLAMSLSSLVNRVVLDRTGLSGDFDVDFKYTPEQLPPEPLRGPDGAALPPIDPNGPSIFTALQEELGLKLESQRGPVDVLVVDHAEHPTED